MRKKTRYFFSNAAKGEKDPKKQLRQKIPTVKALKKETPAAKNYTHFFRPKQPPSQKTTSSMKNMPHFFFAFGEQTVLHFKTVARQWH